MLLLVGALLVGSGCAGQRLSPSSGELETLVAQQVAYAERGASSAEWSTLARQFLRLLGNPLTPEEKERALFGAGICYVYAGTVVAAEGAIQAFEQLLAEFPETAYRPEALYWCAQTYRRTGRPQRAERLYQELINRYPNTVYGLKAWQELAPAWKAEVATERPASPVGPPGERPSAPLLPEESGDLGRQMGLGVQTIVLDPGHGGTDPGAAGPVAEKEITLDIARRLQDLLGRDGYQVRLTREEDRFVPLQERNRMAQQWRADLFLSIHVNWAENAAASGAETWIAAPARDREAAQLAARENQGAGAMHQLPELLGALLSGAKLEESRRLAHAIQSALVQATGARDRGVKEAPFVVLLGLRVPSVLIEVGFLSHAEEGRRLQDPAYRQRIAEGIAEGVRRYLAERTPPI
ncbi:MAG: hypothetical protein KatS3mg115_2609 [Candidatus Poribacteria bacterium]|nr:MAG: hypothetical protein KatS3mg115_2609 [Candidatus Poribacteria bacterium]